MTRVLCIGEAMVEFAPSEQGGYGLSFAGDTFNTAWYLARLCPDWQISFLTAVGQDALSDRFLAFAQAGGIHTGRVVRHPMRTLGAYMIELQDGERSFHYWREQSAARTLADDPNALTQAMGDADIVYVSGITLAVIEDMGRGALMAALGTARAGGAQVVFDPNMRSRLWPSEQTMCTAIMEAAAVADIVLPSFDEDSAFFGDANPAQTIARYRKAGNVGVIVKNGAGAIHYSLAGETGTMSPQLATQVVDTTAAGDSFNAGFMAQHFSGAPLPDAISAASAVSRKVIAGRGALVPIAI